MSRCNNDVLATDGETESKIMEMEQDEFQTQNHILRMYRMKYQKYAFISVGVIVAVIFVILIAVSRATDSSTVKALTDLRSKLVILTNDTKLLTFDPVSRNVTLIFEATEPAVAFEIHDRRMYWAEIKDSSKRLTVLEDNNLRELIDDARFEARGMVLDHISDNLYVVDEAAGNLVVVNIRTGIYALLMELFRPQEIVLDPEEGLMFMLELSNSILRARMDGTDVTKLVNTNATSLTIDVKRKRLYWIDNMMNIKSSNYQGNNHKWVFNDTVTMKNLAILDDRLYWFWPGYGRPSSLSSCEIGTNDTCERYTSYAMANLGDPKYVKAYPSTYSETMRNPCQMENGGCQHLCLLAGKNMRSCACRVGWQMNDDRRSCHEVRDFVLYPQGGFVRVKSIDGSTKDLVWPTPYKVDSIAMKGKIDLDYDSDNGDLYWSDDSHIYRMKLKTFDKPTTILSINDSTTSIRDVAYDWYTGNVYFVLRGVNSHSLMMFNANLGENHRKTLMTYSYKKGTTTHACPYALTLHPANHSMFYACWGFVQHATMNDTSLHRIYSNFPELRHEFRVVAVDYEKDRVYWIWSEARAAIVKHANFDGTDVRVINVDVQYANTIYVHEKWLYVSNFTSIWRVDKETSEGAIEIASNVGDDKMVIAGFRIVSESVQSRVKKNFCAERNGGCEQFCLNGSDGPVCECEDYMVARGSKCLRG